MRALNALLPHHHIDIVHDPSHGVDELGFLLVVHCNAHQHLHLVHCV